MSSIVEQVFRTEWPRLVAALVRDLRDLDLAEDCAQEAFAEAAIRWDVDGVPDRPGAWLLTTARRRGIDRIRRAGRYEDKLALLQASVHDVDRDATGLVDDQLALILGCCHPALDRQAQIALTLRAVAGLSTVEIAAAFLVPEATMAKRLTRAKTKIRKANIPFVTPSREELEARLTAVLQVVYLIFTEGHSSTRSADLVRGDLCDEAAWLAGLLVELVPDSAEARGLAALIRLTDARRPARLDVDGSMVLLADQDRSLWDAAQIESGLDLLRSAHETETTTIGSFTLQAGAAAVHALAPTFAETDWVAILEIYDRLSIQAGTVVVLLNRAIALSYVHGPAAGLAELDALLATEALDGYHYLHSARAELLRRVGRIDEAAESYRRARELCENDAERRFLDHQITQLTEA